MSTRPQWAWALLMGSLFAVPVAAQVNPAQAAMGSPPSGLGKSTDCFEGAVSRMQAALKSKKPGPALMRAVTHSLTPYICYLASEPIRSKMLTNYEQSRRDVQSGATSNSSGSTNLTSKGSSPSLLGFAIEHGGLTQTTSGNTITFRGNAVDSIAALTKKTYLGSYELTQDNPYAKYLSKLSFGISFDTRANQPSITQGFAPSSKNFSGFSAKYDIYNHRDPRDKKFKRKWDNLAAKAGTDLAQTIGELHDTLQKGHPKAFQKWIRAAQQSVGNLLKKPNPSHDDRLKVMQDSANLFKQLFSNDRDVQAAMSQAAARVSDYLVQENAIIGQIRKTPLVTVEYDLSRQLTSNDKNVSATEPNQKIPDLSTVNLVLDRGFCNASAPELTFNVGGTWFNSPNTAEPKRGRVRDIRANIEAEWQLAKLLQLGKPTFSLSGQYLDLIAEPLGQPVMLNGVTIDRRGPMELFQAKLSVPAASSGVKIPISVTWASRTELIKESDVRGNIGITFDLDTLFSKVK